MKLRSTTLTIGRSTESLAPTSVEPTEPGSPDVNAQLDLQPPPLAKNSSSGPPPGHVMGPSFDDDSDDDTYIGDELVSLSAMFDSTVNVLYNPARCGVFLNYLFMQNRDPAPSLFYLVAQFFQHVVRSSKDMLKDQRRMAIEIFTTFLHEKSPLRVYLPKEVIRDTVENIQNSMGASTFTAATGATFSMIGAQVYKLSQDIRHGMNTWKPSEPVNLTTSRSREEELTIFELCLTGRLLLCQQNQKLGDCETTGGGSGTGSPVGSTTAVAAAAAGVGPGTQAYELALATALVTVHRYLGNPMLGSHLGADPSTIETQLTSGSGNLNIRTTLARSFENLTASGLGNSGSVGSSTGSIQSSLQLTGSNLWTKLPHFAGKVKQKSHVHLFSSRKNKHSLKGHNLLERSFDYVAECLVCGNLLWGIAPQGYSCNNCDLSLHLKCKPYVTGNCTKEGRKSCLLSAALLAAASNESGDLLTIDRPIIGSQLSAAALASASPDPPGGAGGVGPPLECTSEKASKHSTWHFRDRPFGFKHRRQAFPSFDEAQLPRLSKCQGSLNSHLDNLAEAAPTTLENSTDDTSATSGELQDSYSVISKAGGQRIVVYGDTTTVMDGKVIRSESRRTVRGAMPFDTADAESKSLPSRSDSLASTLSSPMTAWGLVSQDSGRSGCEQLSSGAADSLPELVTTDWSDDPEMMAGESFEAAVELARHFPDYNMPAKGVKSEDYIRTLCLLEFHQKVQYMVRHLKQYEYLLCQRWPKEHIALSTTLCLDRIPELIQLFRSLVACIDATKQPQGYFGMAEAVLAWLTDNQGANLKVWARHCQALSCTNILNSVRAYIRDYGRRHPDIVPLLQTRHNKFVLIDGLQQMRILYFNLPLITVNIVKDLEKKTKSYKAEAKVWQQIHLKLVSLPQTIDDVCMPLVKRINDSQIVSTLDRKDTLTRQHQASFTPLYDILINFPRDLFHHWVQAHAEVVVDKLTVTLGKLVNHDYIRERTDMLAIILNNALLFLARDNDRFVLRTFKAAREYGGGSPAVTSTSSVSASSASNQSSINSALLSILSSTNSNTGTTGPLSSTPGVGSGQATGNSAGVSADASALIDRPSGSGSLKMAPIFPLANMFTSCGEKHGGDYLLNIIPMNPTVLVRVLFSKESQRLHWYNLLRVHAPKTSARIPTTSRIPTANLNFKPAAEAGKPSPAESSDLSVASAVTDRTLKANEEAGGHSVTPPPSKEAKASSVPSKSTAANRRASRDSVTGLGSDTSSLLSSSGASCCDSKGPQEFLPSNQMGNPSEEILSSIAEYGRLHDKLKCLLLESYGLSIDDFSRIQKEIKIEGVRGPKELLLLGVEFNSLWTRLLESIANQVARQHTHSSLLQPTESLGSSASGNATPPFSSTSRDPAWAMDQASVISQLTVSSSDLMDRRTSSSDALPSSATFSHLQQAQVNLNRAESSRCNRQAGILRVEDHRRSHRRFRRTTDGILISHRPGDDSAYCSNLYQHPSVVEVLLPKLAYIVSQFTKLVNETGSKRYEESPTPLVTTSPEFQVVTPPQSIGTPSSADTSSTSLSHLLDQGDKTGHRLAAMQSASLVVTPRRSPLIKSDQETQTHSADLAPLRPSAVVGVEQVTSLCSGQVTVAGTQPTDDNELNSCDSQLEELRKELTDDEYVKVAEALVSEVLSNCIEGDHLDSRSGQDNNNTAEPELISQPAVHCVAHDEAIKPTDVATR